MVNNKIAQRAVAAGLSGLMAFSAAAPAALAFSWKTFEFREVNGNDDSTYWKRLAGDDRYGTMKEIVKSYNEKSIATWDVNRILWGGSSKDYYAYHSTAVIASGDNFPDALAANGLAGYLTNEQLNRGSFDAVPVILTKAGSLSAEAKDLLKGMQVQNAIIMGGTAAVSQDVEDAINKMGIGTSRVAGADRQETSLKALQRINGNWQGRKGTYDLIIATGDNYADALSISPYAYRMGTPVILTKKDGTLTDAQVEAIKANDEIKEIVIVGGTEAVSDAVMGQIGTLKNNKFGVHYTRLAGADRYETSAKIAEFEVASWSDYYSTLWTAINNTNKYQGFSGSMWEILGFDNGFSFDHVVVATGENFPDALAGGQLAGGVDVPTIDVKDFKGWNAWSPCPLLLVKEGNLMADSLISSEIAKANANWGTTYSSREDLWTTETGWDNVLKSEYKVSDETYKTYFGNWYDTMVLSEARLGYGIMYVTQKQLDSVTNSSTLMGVPLGTTAGYTQNINLEYQFKADGTTLEYCKVNGNFVAATYKSGTKEIIADQWIKMADGGEIAQNSVLKTFTTAPTSNQKGSEVTNVTIRNVIGANAQIIGWSGRQLDFYGIILGGTNAVSNKKRDDLNDVVARVNRPDNFRLADTLTVNTSTYLNTGVQLGVPYNRMSFYGTYTGTVNGTPNTVVDLYIVAGSKHMLGRANGQWYFFANGLANNEVANLVK